MNEFPPFEQWCKEVLHPDDKSPWNFCTQEFYQEYRVKYAIARMIQPKSILEIGVRFGYSARSFLFAAPQADYLGLDIDEPSHGPYQGIPREWAELQLRRRYPDNRIQTMQMDTQVLSYSPDMNKKFDLVHIDGDHSYQGALADLMKFWPACRNTMVVDDYKEVKNSVASFVSSHKDELQTFYVESLRSSALLVRTGGWETPQPSQ
jgi:cephalosporin hydroxylase